MKKPFPARTLCRCLALAATVALAACQQTAPKQAETQPEAAQQAAALQAQRQQAAAAQQAAAQAPVVAFYLAQATAAQGLAPVSLSGGNTLYALPQPVFTQQDLAQIVPMRSNQGQIYLRFNFNEEGARKLAAVTSQAVGHYLVLSVRNQIVAVPQIRAASEQGFLPVPVDSVEQAQAIIQQLQPAN